MEVADFKAVMRYLEAGTGKEADTETVAVYWDLLKDLPIEALQSAARQALAESKYPSLPTAGTLRQLAVESISGPGLTPVQAWQLAMRAARQMRSNDIDIIVIAGRRFTAAEWNGEVLNALPPAVAETMRCIGWQNLHDTDTCRAQFRDAYTQLEQIERRQKLLPGARAAFPKLEHRK
jgi:hypothetical protein